MLADAGNAERRGDTAEGDDETVVVEGALREHDAAAREVDVEHAVAPEAEAPAAAQVANGLHDVPRLHERRGHLGKEGREEQVVLVAHEPDLDVRACREPPLQHAHGFHPREAAPQDHDACRHAESPTPRARQDVKRASWGVASASMGTR